MMSSKTFPKGTLVLFGIFLLLTLVVYIVSKPPTPPPELEGVLRQTFTPIQSFKLADHNNKPFTEERLRGNWTFVFFGYTSCPDICPTTLQVLSSVQGLLDNVPDKRPYGRQYLFVSVDPKRDTTEKLAAYMSYFNSKFTGATADKKEIDRLSWQFGAGYVLEPETAPGHYLVSHTSAIFLVDPLGRLVAAFSQPHVPSTIVSQYEKIQAYFFNN